MKLILIRSPQLLFYKMKSKKEDKNMTMDTVTISYNYCQMEGYNTKQKMQERLILKHICMKTIYSYYRKRLKWLIETEEDELTISVLKEL